MTYRPRATCVKCGISRGLAGGLSRSGQCSTCGEKSLADNLRQMAEKSGPNWEKYRDGMTDYAARLWSGSVVGDTVPESFTQLSLLEIPA